MKKLSFLLALFSSSACLAATAWVHPAIRQVFWGGPPPRVSLASGETRDNPDFVFMARAGIYLFEYNCPQTNCIVDWSAVPAVRAMTQDELDARAAQDASDASNQAYQATLPLLLPNGAEVPRIVWQSYSNGWGWATEALDWGDTNEPPELVTYLFHASPVFWPRVWANREAAFSNAFVRRAVREAGKAGVNGQTQNRLHNLERAVYGVP